MRIHLTYAKNILLAESCSIIMTFMAYILLGGLLDKIGAMWMLSSLIYIGAIYSVGWNKGKKDSRKITGCAPDLKGALISGGIASVFTLLLLIIRICAFHFSAGGVVGNKTTFLFWADFIYRLWNFPLVSFLQNGTLFSYLLPVFYPFIIYSVSYLLGLKKFSFMDSVVYKLIYKKK